MPEKISLSIDDLDLGEAEFFENETGIPLEDVERYRFDDSPENKDKPALPAKALTAFVCIAKRREDSEFTMDQARKLKIGELSFEDSGNPTEGDS